MLAYDKLCEVEDFRDPELNDLIREIFAHDITTFGATFPVGSEHRQHWEAAMILRALRHHGCLRPDAEILGIGRVDAAAFHLTREVRRVWATEISAQATSAALPPWPAEWKPERLVVQHMEAGRLRFADDMFDGAFASSALEHLGSDAAISAALDEVCRVLKPGAVFAVATEFRVIGRGAGWPGVRLFDDGSIASVVIGDRPWTLVDALETDLSPATRHGCQSVAAAAAAAAGDLDRRRFPHVVLAHAGQLYTSVHLTLRKDVP